MSSLGHLWLTDFLSEFLWSGEDSRSVSGGVQVWTVSASFPYHLPSSSPARRWLGLLEAAALDPAKWRKSSSQMSVPNAGNCRIQHKDPRLMSKDQHHTGGRKPTWADLWQPCDLQYSQFNKQFANLLCALKQTRKCKEDSSFASFLCSIRLIDDCAPITKCCVTVLSSLYWLSDATKQMAQITNQAKPESQGWTQGLCVTFIYHSLPITTHSPLWSTSIWPLSVAHSGAHLSVPQSAQDLVPFLLLTLLNFPLGNYPFPHLYVVGWSQPLDWHRTQVWPISHSEHFREQTWSKPMKRSAPGLLLELQLLCAERAMWVECKPGAAGVQGPLCVWHSEKHLPEHNAKQRKAGADRFRL